jgi:tRNA threonylcarbamoyladenosine biosynthesis protein TsaE
VNFHLTDIAELPAVAKQFLDEFGHRKCFAFSGEMGSGKTTFILSVLKAMGINDPDGSPTYSLVNSYESSMYGKVYHLDLYRLKDVSESYDIGIEEVLYGGGISFIEWPEKVTALLPENTVVVNVTVLEDQSRTIKCEV